LRRQVYIIPAAAIVLALLVAGCGAVKTVSPTPTEAGPAEAASYKWAQLLRRDSILPIYDPKFAPTDKAGYDDDELVTGTTWSMDRGLAVEGPLQGQVLRAVPYIPAFPGAWRDFYPDSRWYEGK
jgi:hypothetical protein